MILLLKFIAITHPDNLGFIVIAAGVTKISTLDLLSDYQRIEQIGRWFDRGIVWFFTTPDKVAEWFCADRKLIEKNSIDRTRMIWSSLLLVL